MTDELDELTEKELLADISMQLQEVRHHLRALNPDVKQQEIEQESQYKCTSCQTTVSEDERQQHMERKHNAPEEIDLSMHFVEQ